MEGGGKAPSVAEELTPREREVLQLLAGGRSAKGAAAVLNVSSRTVEFHKGNIMEKTGLRTTAELARFAAKHGLVSESTPEMAASYSHPTPSLSPSAIDAGSTQRIRF